MRFNRHSYPVSHANHFGGLLTPPGSERYKLALAAAEKEMARLYKKPTKKA